MSWIQIKGYRLGIDSNINKSVCGLPYTDDKREIEYKVAFDGVVDTSEIADAFAGLAKVLLSDGVLPVMSIFLPKDYGREDRNERKTEK